MFGRAEGQPPEHGHISQAELQDALLRFEGRFSARLRLAFEPMASSKDAAVRIRAARDLVDYQASALDIVTGPTPESNLLDIVTFIELAKEACWTKWNVDVHGAHGTAVAAALDAAAEDVWRIARTLLDPQQEETLREIIRQWRGENPDVDVAGVRLAAFSAVAGEAASRAEASAHGLLAQVRRGVDAADQARLLGERALFVAHRMPFLIRLQAKLVASEVFEEIASQLSARVAAMLTRASARVRGHVIGVVEAVLDRSRLIGHLARRPMRVLLAKGCTSR
jgi:hypothetical protein